MFYVVILSLKNFHHFCVDFYFKGERGHELFGIIQIKTLNYEQYSTLSYVKKDDCWHLRLDLDANWFNAKDDCIIINIFTKWFHDFLSL